jgi:hypothetical protein
MGGKTGISTASGEVGMAMGSSGGFLDRAVCAELAGAPTLDGVTD